MPYKWVDGKNVYRRVFTGSVPANTTIAIIPANYVSTLISVDGYSNAWMSQQTMINMGGIGDRYLQCFMYNDTSIILRAVVPDNATTNFKVVIEYTKVND